MRHCAGPVPAVINIADRGGNPYKFDFAGRNIARCNRYAREFLKQNVYADTADHDVMYRQINSLLIAAGRYLYDVHGPMTGASVYMSICLQRPSREFIVPRWHQDGKMFTVGEDLHGNPIAARKFAVCVYGAPTLVLSDPPQDIMFGYELSSCNYTDRARLAALLNDLPLVNISTGEIFSFECGTPSAPVHSEPHIITDRIFMSVVPGTELQIRELSKLRRRDFHE